MAEAKLDLTDELLVAYVDDELDASQREMVRSVLASNPALNRRAEEMRLARDLLSEAFPLRGDAAVPRPIEDAANRLAEAFARPSSQRSAPFRFPARRWLGIAAGVVMGGVLAATYVVWRAADSVNAEPAAALMRIEPDTPLYRVLESTPSADVVNVPQQNAAMRAVLTFRAKDGRFCREFEILAGARGATGIACRQQGEWHTEVLLSAAAAPPVGNLYTPAGGSDERAVDEVADRLIQGDALGADDEARILSSGWEATGTP